MVMGMWLWISVIMGGIVALAALFLVWREQKAFDDWLEDNEDEDEWGV
jgi:cytochrome oxidase Cu insertion factor (SCO1/SenC/PrrC family)